MYTNVHKKDAQRQAQKHAQNDVEKDAQNKRKPVVHLFEHLFRASF